MKGVIVVKKSLLVLLVLSVFTIGLSGCGRIMYRHSGYRSYNC